MNGIYIGYVELNKACRLCMYVQKQTYINKIYILIYISDLEKWDFDCNG